MVELIICEKPSAAKKIADALADGKAVKKNEKSVPYYEVTHGDKDIIVTCAVGHLYTVAEKEKKGWTYPVFDIHWVPSADGSKSADFSRKYLNVIKKLCKRVDEFTVACDYDIEGEVIGLNIVRYACKKKDANRMKFSTLTKPDLLKAYDAKSPSLDWGQANAGETRHFLDYYYGINLSRALTQAIKSTGAFKVLSSGRVQGPALKIIVDREKEIKAFVPVPFWQIQLLGNVKNGEIEAWHKEDKFWEKEKAEQVMKNVKGQTKGVVESIDRTQQKQQAPFPFDLTTLQTEAYRCFKISPKETLAIAQVLYTESYISYPRTSSQQIPDAIGPKKIIQEMGKQEEYSKLVDQLLGMKDIKPNNGKKTDPAHPSIYPTGIVPKSLKEREKKIYDIIVKRFFATFGPQALRETMKIGVDVNKEPFIAKGTRTVEKGWQVFYAPYVKLEEIELPAVEKGDDVNINELDMLDKETQPPRRYTPSSIIKALEKSNLGTKSTRAQIVDNLFQRGYVDGTPIVATDLGIKTMETLEKYSPLILDEELTRHFEMEMEEIRARKKNGEEVLEEAKKILMKILDKFKKQEKKIGKELQEANIEARKKAETVGKCPNCDDGELTIRKGKFGRFIACNKYPDCKTTFSLPSSGSVKVGEKKCEECGFPIVKMIRKGKKPQEVCINKECPSKKLDKEEQKQVEKMEEKPCPKCEEGKLVLRKSVYGSFLGCSKYPKCRYTEKLNGEGNKYVKSAAKKKVKKKTKKKKAKKKSAKKKAKKKVEKKAKEESAVE